MQLARLRYLQNEPRNGWYKIRQIFWALKLEQNLSKLEILEAYLNQVGLGHDVQGFSAAADRYFSKNLDQLSVAQTALLLAIVQNPSQFNPITNPELALQRRNLMLQRLADSDIIASSDLSYWQSRTNELTLNLENFIVAPHFVFWVKSQLSDLNLPGTELQVYTTLDKDLYEDSLNILRTVIQRETETKKIHNGAIVVLDQKNRLKALVGSPDFFDPAIAGAVNLAVAPRETGSVLKPFLYALALEKGFSPASRLNDQKTIFDAGYLPRNFNIEEENGFVRFREALANSYNIAAVDLLNQVGVDPFYVFLQTLGINFSQPADDLGLALVLGSGQASLLSITQAFSVFTHQGEWHPLDFIVAVKSSEGQVLYEPKRPPTKKVLSLESAEWTQQVLSDREARWKNFSRGNSLELDFPSGAKTGTSQGFRDNWVVGFSPEYTVGVWVGNADGTPMVSSSGMQGAGPVWQSVMQRVHRGSTFPNFVYKGTRKLSTVCRRPGENECSERVNVFLTPDEQKSLQKVSPPRAEPFAFVYPVNGDVLAEGSVLLLQLRGQTSDIDFYTHNGVRSKRSIFKNLRLGSHEFKAVTLDGSVAKVQNQVESL
jgi:penicillin-binding protein 1C